MYTLKVDVLTEYLDLCVHHLEVELQLVFLDQYVGQVNALKVF